jgi:ABC-type sugar transport system substrate-binding protein
MSQMLAKKMTEGFCQSAHAPCVFFKLLLEFVLTFFVKSKKISNFVTEIRSHKNKTIMKRRMFQWVIAATLICGAVLFTACSKNDNPVNPDGEAEGIAMIVKNGQIDYFRQIETAFRGICQEKGLKAYYYSTSSETAYQEQVAAVAELRKLDSKALKGIILAPSFGPNGESAEVEVAALASERGIPVIILDSPVSATSPLASCPYFGTDNTAAGKAMADVVTADRVVAFAMTNSPGIERAEAFKALKPNAVIYTVGDKANDEVKAVLNDYDDFVFFNGNDLKDALGMLMAAGKRVYTFDVYSEFLHELILGSTFFKGIMAQNTFAMARKAVEAVLTNAKQGEMIPTFYITEDNLGDDNVAPFLQFYNIPAAIDNLAEKILGKWIESEIDGQPAPTTEKSVTTFVSATKALYSSSIPDYTEAQTKWSDHREYAVKITGNKVTLTGHPDTNPNITLLEEYIISDITANEIVCKHRHVTIHDSQEAETVTEKNIKLAKTDTDYSQDIFGTWEGQTSEGLFTRWEIKADGTYQYSRKVPGSDWETMIDYFNQYVVDGYMFYARWKNIGENKQEERQWWEIESIQNGVMKWKALQQNADGTTITITAELTKINASQQ